MIEYNLAAEYGAFIIVIAVLISFVRDYDNKTLGYKWLKLTYYMVFLTVVSTIAAMHLSAPGTGTVYLVLSYAANIIYFMLISSVTLCYILYAVVVTSLKYEENNYLKKLIPPCIPYIIYLVVLLTNIHNGKVFYITEAEGYVRGPWYALPYLLVVLHIIMVIAIIIRHRYLMHHSTIKIIGRTLVLAMIAMGIQFRNPEFIMTGIFNTMGILSIHLYIQNVRKSSDHLTGLYNRMAFMRHLEMMVNKNEDFSLYVFTARGFKMVNERYGIEIGDKALMNVANLFINVFQDEEVYRYNGVEFAVVLSRDGDRNVKLIREIKFILSDPVVIDGHEIVLDMVCARVDYKLFGTSVRELVSAADYTTSILKKSRGDVKYIYDPTVVKAIIEKNNLVRQLESAIANNLFEIHYQPIYSVEAKCFTQAEALVRMRNEHGRLIYPNSFIDVAEKTGLIIEMTYIILECVCRDMRKLLDRHGEHIPLEAISVNFPYLQFSALDMHEKVMEILKKYDIEPYRIKIEITERALIADAEMIKASMQDMDRDGFRFELDDFGVDYSNLLTFLKLPLHIVKLDRSLLLAAYETQQNKEFFQHIVAGINATDRTIVIEGVEEEEQLEFVLECGCSYVQGFYFSRPLPYEVFEDFLLYNKFTQ